MTQHLLAVVLGKQGDCRTGITVLPASWTGLKTKRLIQTKYSEQHSAQNMSYTRVSCYSLLVWGKCAYCFVTGSGKNPTKSK